MDLESIPDLKNCRLILFIFEFCKLIQWYNILLINLWHFADGSRWNLLKLDRKPSEMCNSLIWMRKAPNIIEENLPFYCQLKSNYLLSKENVSSVFAKVTNKGKTNKLFVIQRKHSNISQTPAKMFVNLWLSSFRGDVTPECGPWELPVKLTLFMLLCVCVCGVTPLWPIE